MQRSTTKLAKMVIVNWYILILSLMWATNMRCIDCRASPTYPQEARGFLSTFRVSSGCQRPSSFPSKILLDRKVLKHPYHRFREKWLWKASPTSLTQLILLTNWAYSWGYVIQSVDLLKPTYIWNSHFVNVIRNINCSRTLLVDNSNFLNKMKMRGNSFVTVETLAKLNDLLEFLREKGLQLPITLVPRYKNLTVNEAVALSVYGIGVTTSSEDNSSFSVSGSFSNLITSIRTLAWDRTREMYLIKRIDRRDPRSIAFFTHLGRALITEVTLLVEPIVNMRCRTFSEFSSESLFANPNSVQPVMEEDFSYLVQKFGRVEVTYFPDLGRSWVKIWTLEEKRPFGSIAVNKNFSEASTQVTNIIGRTANMLSSSIRFLSQPVSRFMFDMNVLRMRLSGANDIWGNPYDTLFSLSNDEDNTNYYYRSYVVLTSHLQIQEIVHDFYQQFSLLQRHFKEQGKSPEFRPITIRVSDLDSKLVFLGRLTVPFTPALSVLAPMKRHKEFNTAITFEIESHLGDDHGEDFLNEFELWIYAHFQGGNCGLARPMWGTGWNQEHGLRKEYQSSSKDLVTNAYGSSLSKAIRVLDFYDPHRVFSSPIFENLERM